MSVDEARGDNLNSLEKSPVDTTDLSGAQLPRDLVERFIERTQEESELLDMVRVEDLPRKEMAVPKVGVPELSGDTRDEDGNRPETSSADSGAVEFNVTGQYYYIKYDLKEDAVENTVTSADEVADLILGHFERAWANDVQNIAINAGREGSDLPDSLNDTFDGFISIADGDDSDSDRIGTGTGDETVDSMPAYDHSDAEGNPQDVDTDLFNNMIQAVPRSAITMPFRSGSWRPSPPSVRDRSRPIRRIPPSVRVRRRPAAAAGHDRMRPTLRLRGRSAGCRSTRPPTRRSSLRSTGLSMIRRRTIVRRGERASRRTMVRRRSTGRPGS